MECGDSPLRSYVYTGLKLGKPAIQLTEDLQAVFGVNSAPCLRTEQLWIASISRFPRKIANDYFNVFMVSNIDITSSVSLLNLPIRTVPE